MKKNKNQKIKKMVSISIFVSLIIFIIDRWNYNEDTRAYVSVLTSMNYEGSTAANNVLTYIAYEQLPLKYKIRISENDYNNAQNDEDILAIYQKLDQTLGMPISLTPSYYTTFDGKTPQVVSQVQCSNNSYLIIHYIEFAPPSLFEKRVRVLKWSVQIDSSENHQKSSQQI